MEELLGMFSKTPEDEPKLKGLLATIVSCFGRNLPVSGIIEALQAEEQSEDPAGRIVDSHLFHCHGSPSAMDQSSSPCKSVSLV